MTETKERKLTPGRKSVLKIYGRKVCLLVESCKKLADGWSFVAIGTAPMSNVYFRGTCDLNLDIN